MTSLSYGRIFCLESQKIDGTYQRYNHYLIFFLFKFYFFLLKIWFQFTQNLNLKKEQRYGLKATLPLWNEPSHDYVGLPVTEIIYGPVGLCFRP